MDRPGWTALSDTAARTENEPPPDGIQSRRSTASTKISGTCTVRLETNQPLGFTSVSSHQQ